MKNDTQKFHVGDEVEVTNKKLKTYGTKGIIKELGYSPFYPEADGTVRPHNFDATGHACLVALQGGSTIRLKDANIKVIKHNSTKPSQKVEIGTIYEMKYRNGHACPVVVTEHDFNKEPANNYVLVLHLNAVPTAHYSIENLNEVTLTKIVHDKTLEHLQRTYNMILKSANKYSVVIMNRKISSFTNENESTRTHPYYDERSFYDRRSMDSMFACRDNNAETFKELRSNYETSFTVNGADLEGIIRELVLEKGVAQEHIKVYKLQNPQKVDVKVDINIK
jgi:hypothetical protein